MAKIIRCSPSVVELDLPAETETYPVPQSDLKYWTIFLCQLPGYFCMAIPELQKIPKERDTGDLRKVLDLWRVRAI